jgi:dihydrofolate reductase
MGKVIVTEFVSVDGVFEDPGGAEGYEHGGWTFKFDTGEDFGRFKSEELMAADAQLLGRVTYEEFAKAWPERHGDPFSDKLNTMPKYVVSSTLTSAEWENSTVIGTDLATEVPRLKERYSGDILVNGSGQLVRGLLAADLADEYRLMIFPVILGSGKQLFGDDGRYTSLELAEALPIGTDGVVAHIYRPRR